MFLHVCNDHHEPDIIKIINTVQVEGGDGDTVLDRINAGILGDNTEVSLITGFNLLVFREKYITYVHYYSIRLVDLHHRSVDGILLYIHSQFLFE